MDIGFDRNSWTQDPARRAGEDSGSLEWHGLRARLSAARAVGRALAEQAAMGEAPCAGSFDSLSARVLADYGPQLAAVNPVFWANRKRACTMTAEVAGTNHPGDRG